MLRDASELTDRATLEAEVCVIGGGVAGITIARALSAAGRRVLVLEAGGLERSDDSQDLLQGQMSGIATWALRDLRVRRFGGTSDHWAGWCMPLQEDDLRPRAHIPHSGWPLSLADLAPYYGPAEAVLELGTGHFDALKAQRDEGRDSFAPRGSLETRMFRFSPPTRFGERYRRDLEEASRVEVLVNAAVTNLVAAASGRTLERVEGKGPSGGFTVEAERYVLAAGGIENPRLLLASRDRAPEGVANSSGAVGRYFMDHPHLYDAGRLATGDIDLAFFRRGTSRALEGERIGVFALTTPGREELSCLDFTVEVGAEADPNESLLGLTAADAVGLIGTGPRQFRLDVRAEQSPDPRSRVTLQQERDALGLPKVDLHWFVRDEDRLAYARAFGRLGALLCAHGEGRVFQKLNERTAGTWPLLPGGHHMGTTRMGSSSAMSVVNADCRAHDLDNLYVAGSSVFPTGGSANPTLTIVALALRLADHLAVPQDQQEAPGTAEAPVGPAVAPGALEATP